MRAGRHDFRPDSIRGQLLVWLLGSLIIIGLVAVWDSYRSARSTADLVSDRVLAGSALAIAERVFVNDEGALEVDIPYVALQMLTSSEDDRVFYKIETDTGAFITGYRALELGAAEPNLNDIVFRDSRFRGEAIRLAVHHGAASSSTRSFGFRVGIAETTNQRIAIARSILVRTLLGQIVLLTGAAFVIWFAVARALRPLRRLEEAVNRRNPEDVRPIEHKVPSEVRGLVLKINELLTRFAGSLEALRNFTSNTSHQLRTPLALIKTHLELAQRETNKERQRAAIALAGKAVDNAERLMSQMLLLARLDSASTDELRSKTCDLTDVARDVCEEFIVRFSGETANIPDLGLTAEEPVVVNADRTLIQEVLRNLIDNAIKHTPSPAKIDVAVTAEAGWGFVSVRDHGPGFATGTVSGGSVAGPSAAKREQNGNGGLGLPIVKQIVSLMNGRFVARLCEPPPGMVIEVWFRLSGHPVAESP